MRSKDTILTLAGLGLMTMEVDLSGFRPSSSCGTVAIWKGVRKDRVEQREADSKALNTRVPNCS